MSVRSILRTSFRYKFDVNFLNLIIRHAYLALVSTPATILRSIVSFINYSRIFKIYSERQLYNVIIICNDVTPVIRLTCFFR